MSKKQTAVAKVEKISPVTYADQVRQEVTFVCTEIGNNLQRLVQLLGEIFSTPDLMEAFGWESKDEAFKDPEIERGFALAGMVIGSRSQRNRLGRLVELQSNLDAMGASVKLLSPDAPIPPTGITQTTRLGKLEALVEDTKNGNFPKEDLDSAVDNILVKPPEKEVTLHPNISLYKQGNRTFILYEGEKIIEIENNTDPVHAARLLSRLAHLGMTYQITDGGDIIGYTDAGGKLQGRIITDDALIADWVARKLKAK